MELVIYGLALGIAAVYIVPILAGLTRNFLPATVQANMSVPTAYPASFTAGLWSIVFWGAFLALALWAVSMIKPIGRAVRSEA